MRFARQAYRYYVDSFKGLSREVWILAGITFVNRAGSMVIPFLSLYLTADMGLSLEQVGWIMSCFGAGSVLGSWAGGRFTDRLGFYDVMIGSLVTSGLAFIGLQFVKGYLPFCEAVFVLTLLMDMFRPAIFVAIRAYARPENRTRAVTLIRLAINLGFSLGPAIGGFIIVTAGYAGLFWVDGMTCLLAAGLLLLALPRRKARADDKASRSAATRSPYTDGPFLVLLVSMVLISIWGIGQSSLVLLIGLSDVPQTIQEAAQIDGAGAVSQFRLITLPLVTPLILFNLLVEMMYVWQTFAVPYIMLPGGGPGRRCYFFTMYIYDIAFRYQRFGYACALCCVELIVVLIPLFIARMLIRRLPIVPHAL